MNKEIKISKKTLEITSLFFSLIVSVIFSVIATLIIHHYGWNVFGFIYI